MKKVALCLLLCSAPIFAETLAEYAMLRRARIARKIRIEAAENQHSQSVQMPQDVDEEELYSDKRASYSKGLLTQDNGLCSPAAYNQLLTALQSRKPADFNLISMGSNAARLANPQGAYAFSFQGADSWRCTMPLPPKIDSAWAAAEMVELYWQALMRDVAFGCYDVYEIASDAAQELTGLSGFRGPKIEGEVTAATLFRGPTAGDLEGPYISQFLYQPIPYGPKKNYDGTGDEAPLNAKNYQTMVMPTRSNDNDFVTDFETWLSIQRGNAASETVTFDTTQRHFIRTGRDLAEFVHADPPGIIAFNTALILLGYGSAAWDANNPYLGNTTQAPFVTYGVTNLLRLVFQATQKSLNDAWFQKWMVHRRIRPEYFGFLVEQQRAEELNSNLHEDVMDSDALERIIDEYGAAFLPMSYPEGSPFHPAYPSGHASFIGAGVTILKAFFKESYLIPNPVMPNNSSTALIAYEGDLTVGGELNKLAFNVAMGRNFAGIHWRSDAWEGLLLGERAALKLLEDEAYTCNEDFAGFSLTKFDGTTVTIETKKVMQA